jgi:hypothetical protein
MNLLSSASALKPQKQASKTSTKKQITPGQFLRQAAPVGKSSLVTASPKNPTQNIYHLFAGAKRQTPIQTPTQLRSQAAQNFVGN